MPVRFELAEMAMLAQMLQGQFYFHDRWSFTYGHPETDEDVTFNPATDADAYVNYLRFRKTSEGPQNLTELEVSKSFLLKCPQKTAAPGTKYGVFSDQFAFEGGTHLQRSEHLAIAYDVRRPPNLMSLDGWRGLADVIVAWRVPRYIWFDAYLYELQGRIHKHRCWGGWLGWVPHQVDPATLPDHARLYPVGPGTLIASQEGQVDSDNPEDVVRAQAVETALVELGILPSYTELVAPGP